MLTHQRWTCVFSLAILAIAVGVTAAPNNNPAPSTTSKKAPAAEPAPVRATSRRAAVVPVIVPAQAAESSGGNLPVRRVVLYKSGVGFFEHQGRVQGDESVGIDFTSGQLNDVLQSLTVLDLNGGRITGVDYNSDAPLSQRLGTLSLPLAENTDLASFYGALRGVRLEVHAASGVFTGRLLSIEKKSHESGDSAVEVDLATLVSDSGEVRSVEITPAVTVQVVDREATQEVSRYLSLLASVRQAQMRRMTIATAGTGDRDLYVSYISEVPIWKTTYRIVLPSKANDKPLLQGWAIVDNTVGEDWNDVQLSLVAGAPQSFIQQLSQPYYARRPVVPLPQMAQLMPQTHEGAMSGGASSLSGAVTDQSGAAIPNASISLFNGAGQNAGSVVTDEQGRYEFDDLPAGRYSLRAQSNGFRPTSVVNLSLGGGEVSQDVTLNVGSVSQEVTLEAVASDSGVLSGLIGSVAGGTGNGVGVNAGRVAKSPPLNGRYASGLAPIDQIAAVRQQMTSAAEGSDLGDLFEYKLKDHVTIHKNESALVPILQEHVDAEKVSLWNESLGSARPLRALWLTNSSALTLDGGSFSVLEDETFAGEGITDPVKPGEKRIISYATDLGVRVEKSSANSMERVTKVSISHGVMVQRSEERATATYKIRNDDTSGRTVLIEHPVKPGWSLNPNDTKPDETTFNVYRYRVSVGAKGSTEFTVRESVPSEQRYLISDVTDDQVTFFLNAKSINSAVEAALRKIIAQKAAVGALQAEITRRDQETKKIFSDQDRLRENLKALKGTPEERALTQRYTQQLADEETQLDTLKRESADFQTRHDEAKKQLDDMIQSLNLEADI